ncbi:MAG TPA: DUF4233 domain-containing protein [Pseudonocardiaceae bacterium]|jgi:hypothetical protein
MTNPEPETAAKPEAAQETRAPESPAPEAASQDRAAQAAAQQEVAAPEAAAQEAAASEPAASAASPAGPNPLKGFRGVMAGAIVMEAITVGLALFTVADLYGGLNSVVGYLVGFDILALLLTCAFLRRTWTMPVILVLQLVLVGCIVSAVAVGIVGLLFLAVWVYLFWLRREVARRTAAGQLPSQQVSK